MKISLVNALKERARLTGKITAVFNLIKEENSLIEGACRNVDIREKYQEYQTLVARLVVLKAAIARANASIAQELAELSETRTMLSRLTSISTQNGKIFKDSLGYSAGDDVYVVMNAVLSKSEIISEREKLQEHLNGIQDKIDRFNGSTVIELEF